MTGTNFSGVPPGVESCSIPTPFIFDESMMMMVYQHILFGDFYLQDH
jgi:hypothetical protein